MGNKGVLVDTSLLSVFFRKTDKKKSALCSIQRNYDVYVSTVSEYEFLAGVKDEHSGSLKYFFQKITILPFDSQAAVIASSVFRDLKSKNLLIEFRDIFIGATALAYQLPLATLNTKHFNRIKDLELIAI